MKTCNHCQTSKPDSDFYAKTPTRCKECVSKIVCDWAVNNKERKYRTNQVWRKKNATRLRMMARAHQVVFKAIKNGKLVRPTTCQQCGGSSKIEASHSDYSKPLDVVWLCIKCHRIFDIKDPKTKEGKMAVDNLVESHEPLLL